MKAILIINMPKDCYGCPCYYEDSDQCEVLFKKIGVYDRKPSWCPLRPLPQRKGKYSELNHFDTDFHYEIGWNACLDAITGETE